MQLTIRRALWSMIALVLSTNAVAAQSQLWIRQLGTGADDFNHGVAGGPGGVFVCGSTYGGLGAPNAGSEDAWLALYGSAGAQLWVRQIGTSAFEQAVDTALDGTGGAFVCGPTRGDIGGPNAGEMDAWIARYDGAGSQLWARQIGTSAWEGAWSCASDGSGGLYVGGTSTGSLAGPHAGNDDVWCARYDGAGNQLWIRQFGSSEIDGVHAMVTDGAGGVYLLGSTDGSLAGLSAGGADAWLARYDEAGNQLWSRQFGSGGIDRALAAAADGSGGVYLTGSTNGSLGGPFAGGADAWLARYDDSGNQLWIRQLGTSGHESAGGCVAATGGLFVSGGSNGSLGGPGAGGDDVWFARYDAGGDQLWIHQFGTSSDDSHSSASPDGSGGIYLTGTTRGNLGGSNAGGNDAWLARFDTDIGAIYCGPAIPNSTGLPGAMTATGSSAVVDNSVALIASQLPRGEFGYFLVGQTQGFVNPPLSQGVLCLSGNIGRFNQVAQIIAGPVGSIAVDLTAVPVNPPQAVLPGDTWNFQCWYRDHNPALTSNFTDAVSVTFH